LSRGFLSLYDKGVQVPGPFEERRWYGILIVKRTWVVKQGDDLPGYIYFLDFIRLRTIKKLKFNPARMLRCLSRFLLELINKLK
jgi:hypothetical protein